MKIARILWLLDPTPASGAAPSWKSFHSGSAWMAYVIHFPPLWGANYWINTQLNAIFFDGQKWECSNRCFVSLALVRRK